MPARQLIPWVLFGCLISAAILASFIVVANPTPTDRVHALAVEEARLSKEVLANPLSLDKRRALAMVLWQEGKESNAAVLFTQLWNIERPVAGQAYNPQFAQDAINLSCVYLDEQAYDQSLKCYQAVYAYDRVYLHSDDARIARDLNNLGVAYFLIGSACQDGNRRKNYFSQSNDYLKGAQASASRKPGKIELVADLLDQSILFREMGLQQQSVETEKAAQANWPRVPVLLR